MDNNYIKITRRHALSGIGLGLASLAVAPVIGSPSTVQTAAQVKQ